MLVVASFGDVPAAAFALSRRAENVVNHASRGLGRAGGALAGQNLGAGHVERAKSSMSWSIVYSAIMSVIAIVFFVSMPRGIAEIFSDSPEFIDQASKWIFILAFATFPMSSVQVFTQGIANTGATFAPMIITVITMWFIEIPLAMLLAYFTPLGAEGVPWGIVIGNLLRDLIFFLYFLIVPNIFDSSISHSPIKYLRRLAISKLEFIKGISLGFNLFLYIINNSFDFVYRST